MKSNQKTKKYFLLAVFFLTAVFFLPMPVQAKKVKIQNPIKTEKKTDKKTKKIINSLKKGEIGYVGKASDTNKIIEKIQKVSPVGNYLTTEIVETGQDDAYYKKIADAKVRGVSKDTIMAQKNKEIDPESYYTYITLRKSEWKLRKKYWKMAKKSVKKAGVKNGMSDKKAVKKITKWLCKHTRYKLTAGTNYVDGILFRKGVGQCSDYTNAFWAMCRVSGIPVKAYGGMARGTFGTGGHAWNRVKIGKRWYWIDTCWTDAWGMKRYYLSKKLWKDHWDTYEATDRCLGFIV